MAKRKPDEPKKGAPEWQATFSDLMNLLLCFFVLLFAMSSVDQSKWEEVVASMSSAFSIFNDGSPSIGSGSLVGVGTSQLSNLDEYYTSVGQSSKEEGDDMKDRTDNPNSEDSQNNPNQSSSDQNQGEKDKDKDNDKENDKDNEKDNDKDKDKENDKSEAGDDKEKDNSDKDNRDMLNGKTIAELAAEAGLEETKNMLDQISEMTERYSIYEQLEVTMDSQGKYVEIVINGSVLFDSGKADLKQDSLPLLSKVGDIIRVYSDHNVEIIGHTDNVPIRSSKYESNEMLSSARAISAAMYLVDQKKVSIDRISWTGRGEFDPVASNSNAEGRARNRRVEIRIYNSYNSK